MTNYFILIKKHLCIVKFNIIICTPSVKIRACNVQFQSNKLYLSVMLVILCGMLHADEL